MEAKPILFFDGECGLCHRFVLFVLAREQTALFRFAPLRGRTFRKMIGEDQARELPDSLVLLTEEGAMLSLSDAAVYALKTLSPGWRRVAWMIGVFPKPMRDFGYRCVAAVRKKLFKKPDNTCPLVSVELKGRFLD